MNEKIDILSFCRILTDLTNKDKCDWHPTSHTSRDRLDFKTGYLEITQYQQTDKKNKFYRIDLFDRDDMQYVPFEAEKGIEAETEAYDVFGNLYKAIWEYYIRTRNEKISSFLTEILEQTSK